MISTIKLPNGNVYNISDPNTFKLPADNAGSHNCIYRGMYIGDTLTTAQASAIASGTFDNMYVGDYWSVASTYNEVYYVIAAFDYFLNKGDTATSGHVVTDHHVVLLVMNPAYFGYQSGITTKMNVNTSDTPSTAGGYQAAKSNTADGYLGCNLNDISTFSDSAFGSTHRLTWYDSWPNTLSSGVPSAGSWYASTIDLMTESQAFGHNELTRMNNGSTSVWNYTLSSSQFPIFKYCPSALVPASWTGVAYAEYYSNIWLRNTFDSQRFCAIDSAGRCNKFYATAEHAIVPYICIK